MSYTDDRVACTTRHARRVLTPYRPINYGMTSRWIVPHGRALGVTEQRPTEERYNYSRTDLLARIDVMLGGRASEAIAMGDITTGAENDLVQATRLVRRMITRWGMGSLGPVAFQTDEEQPFLGYHLAQGRDYSDATAARIDQEVEHMIAERQEAVRQLLSEARERLDKLAEALLVDETVREDALMRMLGPRLGPVPPTAVQQPVPDRGPRDRVKV